jgi:cytochrome b561
MDGKVAVDPAARIAHYSLYALLVAVPVAGIVLQFARGDALPLFGIAEISSPWLKDRAFAHSVKEVHEVLAHALVILAAIHAAAALIHHWIFRDRTLVRMLPHSNK